ncbi:MAG TPA: xylose isomerase [Anaerohalosphaeraceae bacterium]|nr:xylose isomerase [Phycisphaerae bacterium]HOK95784.1 xylose isomerase [Anaerohalosphaeraceae bacterium]HOL31248.1 xylose isomerase [Anaerohalosphaeraceae bacterium]HOM75023.1 xylose isomerase [Anaerohalosphaeraceae bacterium]HPC63639.1 xylose isomerase [Anaerohalosphaeraceae bacterium]
MKEYFPGIGKIKYEGPQSTNPLAFRHYDPKAIIRGKTMAEHLRFAVCYWHTFKGLGSDPFGGPTIIRNYNSAADPMQAAEQTMDAAFEFFTKLGVDFWCFHDRDIAPEADNLAETNRRLDKIVAKAKQLQKDTGVKLLWGTTNAFSHRRFMAGAGTNPSPHVFAYAASQIKKAMEITHELGGQGYVFWGGREGYDTLLNTDIGRELDHMAMLLQMAVDHKKKIGFKGQLLIEPKPKEPTKHQYDYDVGNCMAFLRKYGLIEHFKMNIEANHATLAGHTFQHELALAAANGLLGSVDANRGDLLLGWDTDQFPTDIYDTTLAMYIILKAGGFTTGGLNFDAKVRRQSIDAADLFYAHIGAMDAFARGLKIAAKMLDDGKFEAALKQRYAGWDTGLGQKIEKGKVGFEELERYILDNGEPELVSGRQELLENMLNDYIC